MTGRALRALVIALVGSAVLVGPAAALPGSRVKAPTQWAFHLEVKGSQATTWHYVQQTPGPCGVAEAEGDGSQLVTFESDPASVIAIGPAGAGAGVSLSNDSYSMNLRVGRDNEVHTNTPMSNGRQCSGVTTITNFDLPGCGSVEGGLRLRLELDSGGRRLTLRGTDPSFAAGSLEAAMPGCPAFLDSPEAGENSGEALAAVTSVPVSRLLDRHTRTVVIHASAVREFAVGDLAGRTITTYRVTLRRYARVVSGLPGHGRSAIGGTR